MNTDARAIARMDDELAEMAVIADEQDVAQIRYEAERQPACGCTVHQTCFEHLVGMRAVLYALLKSEPDAHPDVIAGWKQRISDINQELFDGPGR